MKRILIRTLRHTEFPQAMQLVRDVFARHVAPAFSEEGVLEFGSFVTLESALQRLKQGHHFLAACMGETLAAVAEVRDSRHICLLFVLDEFQRKGIGRQLANACVELCAREIPGLERITVNASVNAVDAYRRFGFLPTDTEQCHNGIRFVPMALDISGVQAVTTPLNAAHP
ncbi:MAG: GNAT family N-acetyltransferase [Desulfovibrio sp.]